MKLSLLTRGGTPYSRISAVIVNRQFYFYVSVDEVKTKFVDLIRKVYISFFSFMSLFLLGHGHWGFEESNKWQSLGRVFTLYHWNLKYPKSSVSRLLEWQAVGESSLSLQFSFNYLWNRWGSLFTILTLHIISLCLPVFQYFAQNRI